MGWITVLVCVMLVVLSVALYKNIFNPQVLFCGFLGVISFLATIRLFGLSKTSDLTYLLIIIGVIMFFVGVQISGRGNYKSLKCGNISTYARDTLNYGIRKKIVFSLGMFLLIWSAYRMGTTVIPLLRQGFSLDTIRLIYFGYEFQGYSYSRIDEIIEMFVNLPFLYATLPIIAIELTEKKELREIKPRLLVILLIWVVFSCVISGGRVLIYNFLVVFVMAFLIKNKEAKRDNTKRMKTRTKMILLFIVLVMIYVMYQLSINRTGSGSYEFLYQIYIYFCGCLPHTSLRLDTVNMDYTYGMTFISGFLRPLMLIYKYTIGSGAFPAIYQRTIDIGETLQTAVNISEGHTFNAFVLPFYYFYYDGGIIAVIVESLLYGIFCGRAFARYQSYPTKRNLAKYLVIIIYIANSMVRFCPSLVYFALAYIYVDLYFGKEKNYRDEIDESY